MRLSGTNLNNRDGPKAGYDISKKTSKKSREQRKNGSAAKVRDYESHVLVCKGSDCKKRGSKEVRKALKDELRSEGMNREVRIDGVDCLGLCKHGPNVIVYGPNGHGGTWYLGLIEGDAPEIVASHLKGGEPVAHLAAERRSLKKLKK